MLLKAIEKDIEKYPKRVFEKTVFENNKFTLDWSVFPSSLNFFEHPINLKDKRYSLLEKYILTKKDIKDLQKNNYRLLLFRYCY